MNLLTNAPPFRIFINYKKPENVNFLSVIVLDIKIKETKNIYRLHNPKFFKNGCEVIIKTIIDPLTTISPTLDILHIRKLKLEDLFVASLHELGCEIKKCKKYNHFRFCEVQDCEGNLRPIGHYLFHDVHSKNPKHPPLLPIMQDRDYISRYKQISQDIQNNFFQSSILNCNRDLLNIVEKYLASSTSCAELHNI